MVYPCQIYAIYPYDEKGQIAGVYVGSSHDAKVRISSHLNCRQGQEELHELMKKNGFAYQILDNAQSYAEQYIEYDWIDFFHRKTDVKLFNLLVTGGCADRICQGFSKPVWNGKGIVWEMNPKKATHKRAFTLFAKEYGFTLTQVANAVGMRVQNFNRRLDGAYEFTSQEIEKLKSLFPTEPSEVIEGFIGSKGEI